jgi:hypothetical protein
MAMNYVMHLIQTFGPQLQELLGPPALCAVAAVLAAYVFIVFARPD